MKIYQTFLLPVKFPSTFIKSCHSFEEVEPDAKWSRFGGIYTHVCYMKFDLMRISFKKKCEIMVRNM